LFTVVRRKLWKWRADRTNRILGSGDEATHELLREQPAPETDEAEWTAEWERRVFAWACEQVRHEVADATWQAFWRTAVEHHPVKQVAADLGLTPGAIYIARSRVINRLKERVQSVQDP
jgi:RNA polymerase sigma-70 factor (ECF subfamily)